MVVRPKVGLARMPSTLPVDHRESPAAFKDFVGRQFVARFQAVAAFGRFEFKGEREFPAPSFLRASAAGLRSEKVFHGSEKERSESSTPTVGLRRVVFLN
jgi:hypothetical protein